MQIRVLFLIAVDGFGIVLSALHVVLDSFVDLQIYIGSPSKTEAEFITNP